MLGICPVLWNFSLWILFTHIWCHKCLVSKKTICWTPWSYRGINWEGGRAVASLDFVWPPEVLAFLPMGHNFRLNYTIISLVIAHFPSPLKKSWNEAPVILPDSLKFRIFSYSINTVTTIIIILTVWLLYYYYQNLQQKQYFLKSQIIIYKVTKHLWIHQNVSKICTLNNSGNGKCVQCQWVNVASNEHKQAKSRHTMIIE